MEKYLSETLNIAIQKAIQSVLNKKKTAKKIGTLSNKKKLFDSCDYKIKCSRMLSNDEIILLDSEPIFCNRCLDCLFYNQTRKQKMLALTWAPKKKPMIETKRIFHDTGKLI